MSNSSSARGSPYSSSGDLRADESFSDITINGTEKKRSLRRGVNKRQSLGGGIDLDDAEFNLRRYQQETSEVSRELEIITKAVRRLRFWLREETNRRKMNQTNPLTALGYDKENEHKALTNIRGQSQAQSRKIHDLQLQFEEARIRIDKLLQRKSRSRSDFVNIDRRSSSTGVGRRESSTGVGRRESSTSIGRRESATHSTSSRMNFTPTTVNRSISSESNSSNEASGKLHVSSVTVNPANKLAFAPVSLTVHVDSD